jgi:lysyl-tRNA synthetase, class II
MSIPFIEDNDQTEVRRQHLKELRRLVGNVYPNKFERSRTTGGEDTITAIVENEEFKRHVPEVKEGERPAPDELERANAELNQIRVRISGRISSPPRVMGKAAFVHLSDGVSRLQIYVRKADVKGIHNDDGGPIEQGWELFNLLDHGDFIGAGGYLFVTKTGELSVHVETIQFLAKAMLPMPDKLHGIADPEIRQRQRYADLIAGSLKVDKSEDGGDASASRELSSREVFERRSRIIREMRRFLDDHGYIEVETPMLSPKATGAAARPFKTHHNALDIDLYSRIAPELYLKRLVVGGFEKVYELNRNFRNEGIDRTHNPEFTMLEFYCAYMDVNGMMDFCEQLITTVIEKLNEYEQGENRIKALTGLGNEIDFRRPWPRLTMKQAIALGWPASYSESMKQAIGRDWPSIYNEYGGVEFDANWLNEPKNVALLAEFQNVLETRGGIFRQDIIPSIWKLADEAVSRPFYKIDEIVLAQKIERLFGRFGETGIHPFIPTFIIDFPKPISPLSKASPADSSIAERFELFIAGMECANGFSELNDPEEQYERFMEQAQARERGDEEAMVLDEDYIRALSYGMPPAAGIGIGIDRLVMLLTNKRSIRDVILFPHMRPERKAEEIKEETGEANQEAV